MNDNVSNNICKPDLSVSLGPLTLLNPVIAASGTFGFGSEMKAYLEPDQLGAITVKGITKEKSSGNAVPRLVETPAGILNAIGLENPGLQGFIHDKIEEIKEFRTPVIVNISGHSLDDFAQMASSLNSYSEITALEVNVSCPNIAGGGMVFGTDKNLLYKAVKTVREEYSGPLIVKLSPNVTDIVEMAQTAVSAGADILSLINTLLGMAIDVETQKPILGNGKGGLSGPAVKPVALRMVYEVAAAVEVPIIGMGGIMTGEDALEFILAGADAVGVGTATLVDPEAAVRIKREIYEYLQKKEITDLGEIRGKALSV